MAFCPICDENKKDKVTFDLLIEKKTKLKVILSQSLVVRVLLSAKTILLM